MNRQEKTAWYCFIMLTSAFLVFALLFIFVLDSVTTHISINIMLTTALLILPCRNANVLFTRKQDIQSQKPSQQDDPTEKSLIMEHSIFWGFCILVLAGTWTWLSLLTPGEIAADTNQVFILSATGMIFLYLFLMHRLKFRYILHDNSARKRSFLSIVKTFQYYKLDERDKSILKKAEKYGFKAIWIIGGLTLIAFQIVYRNQGGLLTGQEPHLIPLIIAAALLVKYYTQAVSIILQYRIG